MTPEAEARRLISQCTGQDFFGLSAGEVVYLANVLAAHRYATTVLRECRDVIVSEWGEPDDEHRQWVHDQNSQCAPWIALVHIDEALK